MSQQTANLDNRKDTLRQRIIAIETDESSDPEIDYVASAQLWTDAYQEVCAATSHAELDRIEDWYDIPPTRCRKSTPPCPRPTAAPTAPDAAETYSRITLRLDDARRQITVLYEDGHGRRVADPEMLGPYPADAWPQIRTETRRAMRDLAAEHAAVYTEEVTT